MAILKRSGKSRREKPLKPEVVTGSFELHYEDVISRNRFLLVGLFATGLVLLAAFIPSAVYHSVAENNEVTVEAEKGIIINPDLVTQVEGDISASGNSYIEFRLIPAE